MIITTDEAPLPNDAQLNWSRALESLLWSTTVSYTHLTLPTIYSV